MIDNKLKILSVDDDMINRKLLKAILNKMPKIGSVLEARDGSEGLAILKENPDIDLVFLDVNMPIMNGIEMLKIMRSEETLSGIPVIILTTDETKKTETLEVGANMFLTKPILEKNIADKIEALGF
jgi:CheY-like chemotaxis protein